MKVKSICKHRVLAGFLTFFMIVSLIISGTFFALKGGIFSGTSIKELMEVNGLDIVFAEFCDDIFDNEIGSQDMEWLMESDNYGDIKDEMSNIFFECFFERQDSVDFDKVVDLVMESIEEESDVIVDDVFDEIEKEGENFDARNNTTIQAIIDKYDFDDSEEFYENLDYYASDLDNLDEYRDDIKEQVDEEVVTEIKNNEDEFKADLEASFDEMLDEYYDSEAFRGMEEVNGYLSVGTAMITMTAVISLAIAVICMISLCVLYKESIFGAFSKLAIASGVAIVFIGSTGLLKYLIKYILNEFTGEELKAASVESGMDILSFINKLIDIMFNPFLVVGVILLVTMIVSIFIWKITKTSFKNKLMSQMYYNENRQEV